MRALPPGWRIATVGELADTALGKMLDKGRPHGHGHVPYLRNMNVQWGRIDTDDILTMEISTCEQARFEVRAGDLLVCEGGEVGRSALWKGTFGYMAYQKALHRVRSRGQLVPTYLRYLLEQYSNDGTLARFSTGSTIAHFPQEQLRRLPVPLPDVDEQRRIVEILEDHLSRLDAAERLLTTSAQRGVALLRATVDDVFDRSARSERWRVVTLGELASREPRSITDGPFGSNLARRHYRDEGARVVRLQNIADGVFKASDAFISLEHYRALSYHDVREGDVVVASLGAELPRAAVVPDLGGPAIVKADCIRVRPEHGIQPEWLVIACRATASKRWAKTVVHGVGRQRLGMAGIRAIPVPLPSSETRERVLAHLTEVEQSVNRMDHQVGLSRLRGSALRRALLEAAFSGRLTGSATDDEVVEELAEA